MDGAFSGRAGVCEALQFHVLGRHVCGIECGGSPHQAVRGPLVSGRAGLAAAAHGRLFYGVGGSMLLETTF